MNLVSTEWLEKNLSAVKIFDASWHMPSTNRMQLKNMNKNILLGQYFGMSTNTRTRIHHTLT